MTPDRVTGEVSAEAGGARLTAATCSDRGTVREQNQDVVRAVAAGGALLLALADGMGGHAGGLEAADAAVAAAVPALERGDDAQVAVEAANAAVAGVRSTLGGFPGTTLITGRVEPERLRLGHVGDSRAYVVRGGAAVPITTDHSWAAQEVAAGRLSAEVARHDPRRNRLVRAVMGDPVEADVIETPLESGDVVLLCSDGLWEPLADSEIAALLSGGGALAERVGRLVDAALAAGSRDNVTALAVEVGPA